MPAPQPLQDQAIKAAPQPLVKEQEAVEEDRTIPGIDFGFEEHFQLMELLGKGEYGNVFKCRSKESGTLHACKVVPKEREDRTLAENLARIECEINIWRMSQISEFVIRCDGVFQDHENVYMIQELCTGGDIRAVLDGGLLSEHQVAEVTRAVLDVIAACHVNGFMMGDIKPANFLLKEPLIRHISGKGPTPPICVRATDFGFSRTWKVQQRHTIGSPVYMAPELWAGDCGPEADVWAAGVMMYQCVCGRYPFWDLPADQVRNLPMHQVMMAVSSNPIRFEGPEWERMSKQARKFVMLLLDRDPASRISARAALDHPWLTCALGFHPTLSFTADDSLDSENGSSGGASRFEDDDF